MFVSAQVVRCSSGKPNGRHSTCLLNFDHREDDFEWRGEKFKVSSAIIWGDRLIYKGAKVIGYR